MVQLLAVAGIGAVAIYAYTSLRNHLERLEAEEQRQKRENAKVTELEQDPKTGVYRPKND
ncbi:MAG: hypothetical protein AAFU56_01520 [Pseudomonadota bacterium]